MSRFNTSTKEQNVIQNYEGAKAYALTPEMELYTAVCTAGLQNKFYESNDQFIARLNGLLKKVDSLFAQKLAIYAREQMYLRSVPLVVCVELAKIGKLNAATVERVIQRVDEITEILAYYQVANARKDTKKLNKLSKAIKQGIKQVFESGKFDRYQLQKYNRKTEITLMDALFLTHPKPQNKDQDEMFKQLISDTLPIPKTWEVMVSEAPKLGKDKKEIWQEVIDVWILVG